MSISEGAQRHADLNASMAERLAKNPDLDIETVRDIFDTPHRLATEAAGVSYEDVQVGRMAAIWAIPQGVPPATKAILYFHGGGFMTGSPNSHRKLCGHLAKTCSAWVLSIDYRRSPEHKFPAQLDDCVDAYKWLLTQGYKASSLATCGDSAGGNLAVSSVLKLRDEGVALPAAMIAFSPWCDMEMVGKSIEANDKTDALVSKGTLQMMTGSFIGEASPKDPLVNPLYADFKGMPPLHVSWSTTEVLADDSVSLSNAAKKAGVEVVEDPLPNLQHVHVFCAGKGSEADKTLSDLAQWLGQKFNSS